MLKIFGTTLFLIAGLIAVDVFSLVYSPCEQTSNQREKPQSAEEGCGFTTSATYRWTAISVDWIDRRHDFVTAASTVVIAIFTIILGVFTVSVARATKVAADAADLSAKAAVAIELPVIKAEPVQFGFGSSQDGDGPRIENCSVTSINFANAGRTKAIPIEVQYGWAFGKTLPEVPVYAFTKRFRIDDIINPNDTGFLNLDQEFAFEQGINPYELVRTAKVGLWFYCRIIYLDFMQSRHESGFCWRRHEIVGNGLFIADATPAYNRKT